MEQTADDLRDLIVRRREFVHRSAEFWQWLEESKAALQPGIPRCTIRCSSHKDGKSPRLAEAALVRGHMVFSSRIDMTARDRVEPPPWTVEALLGAGVEPAAWEQFQDDDALMRYAESLRHHEGDTRWWAPSRKYPTWLEYAIPLTDPHPPMGLWVRCKDHPAEAESLSMERLFANLR